MSWLVRYTNAHLSNIPRRRDANNSMCMKSYMRLRVLFYFSAPTDVAQDEEEEITINIPLIESKKEKTARY